MFHIKGRFTPALRERPAWAHPIIHDGRLYFRHGDVPVCYDLYASWIAELDDRLPLPYKIGLPAATAPGTGGIAVC